MTPTMVVLFNSQHSEEQEFLAGVRAYAAELDLGWNITPLFADRSTSFNRLKRISAPAVILGRDHSGQVHKRQTGVHWVAWGNDPQTASDAIVDFDIPSIGQVAADYLIRAGARTLAVKGPLGNNKNQARRTRLNAFVHASEQLQLPAQVVWQGGGNGDDLLKSLRTFCEIMPQPIGFFAYHDQVALSLAEFITELGFQIPEQVMILGGSRSAESAVAPIPISSIRLPFHALGKAAATQAHCLLSGTRPDPIAVKAIGVVERHSTLAQRHDDPVITRALKRVAKTKRPIPTVTDLAKDCLVHRQQLHTHFRRSLQTTPSAWLEERAMQRAAQLLAETELSMTDIARQCGIAQRTNLSARFKRRFGMTPTQYREKA